MFLRAYRPYDKRLLQQLFFDTVHTVNSCDYTAEQLSAWAPCKPDPQVWHRLDSQFCFVVECQKTIVGFASLSLVGLLDFLYVHPDFQGKGVATALCKQLERLARKRQFQVLQAEASPGARGFFEKRGFVCVSENQKTQYGIEIHNYTMEKVLRPTVPDKNPPTFHQETTGDWNTECEIPNAE